MLRCHQDQIRVKNNGGGGNSDGNLLFAKNPEKYINLYLIDISGSIQSRDGKIKKLSGILRANKADRRVWNSVISLWLWLNTNNHNSGAY